MNKQILIARCEEKKSGLNKKGQKWTLYAIEDGEGVKYKSFNKLDVGNSGEAWIEESQYGKEIKKFTPGGQPPAPSNLPSRTDLDEVFERLQRLEDGIREIVNGLKR